MIVAITGANGFIGRHLVRHFGEAGWDVRPVVRRDYERGTVVDLFARADVVVHAAGATRAPSRARLRAANVELTERTLAAARQSEIGRFVFVSSQAAAGPAPSRTCAITEDEPPHPVGAYGHTKLDAERLVRASGLSFAIVRPGAVYGPWDRDFLAMHRLARRGIALHPGNREQWTSLVHSDDLADGIFRASTDARAMDQTFFLANPDPVQWHELFRLAAACSGRTLRVDVEIPSRLVDVAAMVGDVGAWIAGRAGLLTSDKVALSKPRFWICSSERARQLLGFVPRIALQHGLCETYHWYRSNGWL
jgi:nucleoside-diphosphate-sugar epimerase